MPGGDSVPSYIVFVSEADSVRANIEIFIKKMNEKVKDGHWAQGQAEEWQFYLTYAKTNIDNMQAQALVMANIIAGA